MVTTGRHRGPAAPDYRAAAVIALLYFWREQWYLPFLLRPAWMTSHAGQISLPGGATDAGETAEQCALRELGEELGVTNQQVRVLGRLSPICVFASNFCVTPFVAACSSRPDFHPNRDEVEHLFELPLEYLLDPVRYGSCLIRRGGLQFRAPGILVGKRRIWGATGVILDELLPVLDHWLQCVTRRHEAL